MDMAMGMVMTMKMDISITLKNILMRTEEQVSGVRVNMQRYKFDLKDQSWFCIS
jgi:hypothetical protein